MGNQLCPASTKDLIQDFAEIQKGQKSYEMLFKGCLSDQNAQTNQLNYSYNFRFDEKNPSGDPVTQETSKLQRLSLVQESNQWTGSNQMHKLQMHGRLQQEKSAVVVDIVLSDGWRYSGETVNGVPDGEGEEYGPNGDYYKGHFRQGQKEGYGVYKFANSAVYRGQFRGNVMWGYGVFEFTNGDCYEGEFVNNVREGKGRYTPHQPNFEGLLYFEGEYTKEMKNGPGLLKYEDCEVKGVWKDGQYDYSFENGNRFLR